MEKAFSLGDFDVRSEKILEMGSGEEFPLGAIGAASAWEQKAGSWMSSWSFATVFGLFSLSYGIWSLVLAARAHQVQSQLRPTARQHA